MRTFHVYFMLRLIFYRYDPLFCVWKGDSRCFHSLCVCGYRVHFILSLLILFSPAFTALELYFRLEMINVNRCPSPVPVSIRRQWMWVWARVCLETTHTVYEQWLEICLATSPNFISLHYNSWVLTKHIYGWPHMNTHIQRETHCSERKKWRKKKNWINILYIKILSMAIISFVICWYVPFSCQFTRMLLFFFFDHKTVLCVRLECKRWKYDSWQGLYWPHT